jgi:predicted nucleic acid-binding protein
VVPRKNLSWFHVEGWEINRVVLVDTSVWVAHLREGNAKLEALLNEGMVVCHPFIIGELACGTMRSRAQILSLLQSLPTAEIAEHSEVLLFIEHNRLVGKGLGYVDVHLLASAVLTDISLWTLDRKLQQASARIRIDYKR